MNHRIYNPPIPKAGEPTPADAQATATTRIPNVTAINNELSQRIVNENSLKTEKDAIDIRVDQIGTKIEELNDLIQTEMLSATFKEKQRQNEKNDEETAEDEEETTDTVPSMHTIPTIVYRQGGMILGWAEVTYGKIKKPENYDAIDEDIYHIYARVYWDQEITNIIPHRQEYGPPVTDVTIAGLPFPMPSSRFVYLCGYTRSRRPGEYWNMWDTSVLGGQHPNLYTEAFDPNYQSPPGPEKTVNVSMMLRGWQEATFQPIGEDGDTVVVVENKMKPSGGVPIVTVYGNDWLRPGSPDPLINLYAYCCDTVVFCTKSDLIEWNRLAKLYPQELYEIPLID